MIENIPIGLGMIPVAKIYSINAIIIAIFVNFTWQFYPFVHFGPDRYHSEYGGEFGNMESSNLSDCRSGYLETFSIFPVVWYY